MLVRVLVGLPDTTSRERMVRLLTSLGQVLAEDFGFCGRISGALTPLPYSCPLDIISSSMRIFVIGSYSGDKKVIEDNVQKAVEAGKSILKKGHLPLVPQSMFAYWEKDIDMEEIMKVCFKWIEECDAVLVLNVGSRGEGTWSARDVAQKGGKTVFTDIDEIPESRSGV